MSAAIIPCPGCRAPLSITPELVGKTIACPACRQTIQLAGAAANPAPPQNSLPRAKPIADVPAQQTAAPASAAVASYQSKRNSIGLAILLSWVVVAVLDGCRRTGHHVCRR